MKRDLTAHPDLSPERWVRRRHGQHHAVETIVRARERQPHEGGFMVAAGRCTQALPTQWRALPFRIAPSGAAKRLMLARNCRFLVPLTGDRPAAATVSPPYLPR